MLLHLMTSLKLGKKTGTQSAGWGLRIGGVSSKMRFIIIMIIKKNKIMMMIIIIIIILIISVTKLTLTLASSWDNTDLTKLH